LGGLRRESSARLDPGLPGQTTRDQVTAESTAHAGAWLPQLTRELRLPLRVERPDEVTGNFIAPHGIALDSTGAIYVSEVIYTFGLKPNRVSDEFADHLLQKFEPVSG
jgi:hypothetical protein